jgi:hypothetical protein
MLRTSIGKAAAREVSTSGIERVLARILPISSSPSARKPSPPIWPRGKAYRIQRSGTSLARLSFFLWSSGPDETMLIESR